ALKKNETPRGSAGRPAVRKVQDFPEVQTSAAAARGGTADRARRDVPVLWCIKQIAAYYGCTSTTVHRWDRAGLLPAPIKSFGSRRWDRDVLVKTMRSPMGPKKQILNRKGLKT